MKRLFAIIVLLWGMLACQDEARQELMQPEETDTVQDSIPTLVGEFIYVADAAVFRGNNFIYGVTIDSMSQELANRVQPYKKEDFDMVKVKIKGKIVPNTQQEGWEENIEIREILEILEEKDPSANNNQE